MNRSPLLLYLVFCLVFGWGLGSTIGALKDALAVGVEIKQDTCLFFGVACTAGPVVVAAPMNVDIWTGWIYVATYRSITFDIELVRDAATDVQMRCETSDDPVTANDAGFDLHAIDLLCAAGACTATSGILTWLNAVLGAELWTWQVTDIPGAFVNCLFTGTAAGVDDELSATARGISP